jgi:hypothetical protein
MRLPTCLALALALTGCNELATLAELPAPAPLGVTGSTAPAAPAGESLPPLDLAGSTWVEDQPGGFKIGDGHLEVAAGSGNHFLYYQPPLGQDFSFHFKETRAKKNGWIELAWPYDPVLVTKDGKPKATNYMALDAKGNVVVKGPHAQTIKAADAPGSVRVWDLEVKAGHSSVKLNGKLLFEFDNAPGYHPSPMLTFRAAPSGVAGPTFDEMAVASAPPGPCYTTIHQFSLAGRGLGLERLTVLAASDLPKLSTVAQMGTLAAVLPYVAKLGGGPLYASEGLVNARTDGRGESNHHTLLGEYLHASSLSASAVSAHEIAHGYGQGGSRGARSPEGWLVEGLADYLGPAAYRLYRGQPAWALAPTKKPDGPDPLLSETNDETTARWGKDQIGHKIYGKGALYLALLEAYTSQADVAAVIEGNRHASKVTGEQFVAALEKRTGKDLAFLRPGWLTAGPYAPGCAYQDTVDSDKDGLLDFQEVAMKTRPDLADTDGDGASDFAERVAGTNPLDPASYPARPGNGLAAGMLVGPTVEEPPAVEESDVAEDAD